MRMSGVSVTVDDREVLAMLGELQRRLDDMTPVMNMIGSALVDEVKLGFNDSLDPWGAPWAPLSPVTVRRRRKGSSQPLRDTGRLMNSITHRATRDSVTVGTNVEYAPTHQFGARQGQYGRTKRNGPIPWGNVPARPLLPLRSVRADLPDAWRDDILNPIIEYLTKQ